MHPIHTPWFGLDPKGAGFGCITTWAREEGKQSLISRETLAGDTSHLNEAIVLQCPVSSGSQPGGLESRAWSHPWDHELYSWVMRPLWPSLWAEKELIQPRSTHSLNIHLPSDFHVSCTSFLHELTVCLFYYIEETRHSLQMRGLEIKDGLRLGENSTTVESGCHGFRSWPQLCYFEELLSLFGSQQSPPKGTLWRNPWSQMIWEQHLRERLS